MAVRTVRLDVTCSDGSDVVCLVLHSKDRAAITARELVDTLAKYCDYLEERFSSPNTEVSEDGEPDPGDRGGLH